jgi:ABC-type uncharacterized transport system involved in gliding motility auxiliary subunit
MLVGVYTMTARVMYAPIVLFWLDNTRTLMPLVIQLSRSETPEVKLATASCHFARLLSVLSTPVSLYNSYSHLYARLQPT